MTKQRQNQHQHQHQLPPTGLLDPEALLLLSDERPAPAEAEPGPIEERLSWLRLAVAHMTSEHRPIATASPVRIGSVSVNGKRIPTVWRGDNPVNGAWVPLVVAVSGKVGFVQFSPWDDLDRGQVDRLWSWLLFGAGSKDASPSQRASGGGGGGGWDPRPHLENWGNLLSGVPLEDLVDPPALPGHPQPTSRLLVLHPYIARLQSQEPWVRAIYLPVLMGLCAFDALLINRVLQIGFMSVDDSMTKKTWKSALDRRCMPMRLGKPGVMMGLDVESIARQAVCSREDRAHWVSQSLRHLSPALLCICSRLWQATGTTLRAGPNRKAAFAELPQSLQRDEPMALLGALTTLTLARTAPALLYSVAERGPHAYDVGTNVIVAAMATVIAIAVKPNNNDPITTAKKGKGKSIKWTQLADFAACLLQDATAVRWAEAVAVSETDTPIVADDCSR